MPQSLHDLIAPLRWDAAACRAAQKLFPAGGGALLPAQRELLGNGDWFRRGLSGLLEGPTGCGKSRLALLAALRAHARGGRVIYAAPTIALAQEIHATLQRSDAFRSEELELRAGLSVAAGAPGPDCLARILVGTYEAALPTALQPTFRFGEESLLVVDEAQYLADPTRGPLLWVVLQALRNEGFRDVQVLLLASSDWGLAPLAERLSLPAYRTALRPVPLREAVYCHNTGELLDATTPETPLLVLDRQALESPITFLTALQRELGTKSALWFHPTRASLWETATAIPTDSNATPALADASEETAARLGPLLALGIGIHCAEVPQRLRSRQEEDFRSGKLHTMLATSTVTEGVNLDADLVLQGMWELSGDNGGILGPKRLGAYRNAAGRAGRPGNATQGWSILWTRSTAERDRALHFLRAAATPLPPEPFRWRDTAIAGAIRHLRLSDSESLNNFLEFIEPGRGGAEPVLEKLEALRWIKRQSDKLFCMTEAGALAGSGIVPPLLAHHCAAAHASGRHDDLTSVFLSAWTERFGFQLRQFRLLQSRDNRLELFRQLREGESLCTLADRFRVPEGLLEDWQSFANLFDKIVGMARVAGPPPSPTPAPSPKFCPRPMLIVHLDSNGDVTYGDRRVSLTKYQFALLELLARRLESGATYRAIFDYVWQGMARVEQQQIGYLRRVIEKRLLGEDAKSGSLIETRPGFGLVLRLSKEQVRIERAAASATLRDSRGAASVVPPVRTRRTLGLKSGAGSGSILPCVPATGSTLQNRPLWHRTAPRW